MFLLVLLVHSSKVACCQRLPLGCSLVIRLLGVSDVEIDTALEDCYARLVRAKLLVYDRLDCLERSDPLVELRGARLAEVLG